MLTQCCQDHDDDQVKKSTFLKLLSRRKCQTAHIRLFFFFSFFHHKRLIRLEWIYRPLRTTGKGRERNTHTPKVTILPSRQILVCQSFLYSTSNQCVKKRNLLYKIPQHPPLKNEMKEEDINRIWIPLIRKEGSPKVKAPLHPSQRVSFGNDFYRSPINELYEREKFLNYFYEP